MVLVDDHPLIRDGLRRSLEDAGLEVVGEAADGAEAVAVVQLLEGKVDVLLLDAQMPVMGGLDAAKAIRARYPHVEAILLSAQVDPASVREAVAAGLRGFLVKEADAREVIEAVRLAARGNTVIGAKAMAALSAQAGPEGPKLTPRQLDILRLLARGETNLGIASNLYISLSTVKVEVEQITQALGMVDRTSAVAEAVRQGIIE